MEPKGAARTERRLAAILAADIAGYSRLMGEDEEGTLARLKALRRELADPKVEEHRGRIVKTTGDGLLIEFGSVVDAVRCAVDVQQEMAERNADLPRDRRIEFRIGINLGDIIRDEGDIYGDGVNVAARLEALAEPGGICVSRVVRDQVLDKLDLAFEDQGEQHVKNIARPVHVWRLRLDAGPAEAAAPAPAPRNMPSLVVLPFQNMSGDPEQDYFADGIVEEITTAIARLPSLLVIPRNSAFAYKGRAIDVKQVARELGVRYVLEGSVRKSGNRVRITGQLIDTATAAHIWADRFDGALDDIFELQDRIASSVAVAIEPKLRLAEIARAYRTPTDSLDAYDLYLRAVAETYKRTKESMAESVRLARRALVLSYQLDRADEAVAAAERALSLSPFDPDMFSARMALAYAHLGAGRYEAALPWAQKARRENGGLPALRLNLSLCGHLGRRDEAVECLRQLREILPEPTVAALDPFSVLAPEITARINEGLRKAGLPEA